MTKPTSIHTANRIHVSALRLSISHTVANIDTIGSHGTNGTRNARGNSGRVRRRINTLAATTRNANSVPMLTITSISWIGVKPATAATTTAINNVLTCGVPY